MTDPWYSLDPPIQDLYLFFGRQTEMSWLIEQLVRDQRVVAVYGPHRIGKTSLLHALIDRLPKEYLAIYLDADKTIGWDSASPLLQIAGEVGRKVREQTEVRASSPDAALFAQDPLYAWQSYIGGLDERIAARKLVLLIDNAECASPEWLHILLETSVPVVVAAESHERLSERLHGTTFAPPAITLGPLENDAAEDLVRALVTPKSPIDPWAVRRLLEMASDQPYYIHLVCRVLLECCTYKSPITPPQVESALESILDMPIAEFIVEWESSLPREQVVLAVFAAMRGVRGAATQYDLQKAFSRDDQSPPLADIVITLNNLAQRGLLERMGTNSYRFRLELFRLWVQHHHRPQDLLRKKLWRFRRSLLGGLAGTLQRKFASRRTLWLSVGAAMVVVALVAVQPILWRREPRPTPAPRLTITAPVTSRTALPTLGVDATKTLPEQDTVLPGYDLLMMSRTDFRSPWQVYALNSRTGKRLRLTETDANDRTPKWAPDGRHVAFASDRDGDRDIYVMDLAGAQQGVAELEPVNLTQNEVPDWQPAWSPDGKRIAFSSYRDGNWEIYIIGVDGSDLVRITDHPESDISPTWSPDGAKLLFVSRRLGDADLFVHDFVTGERTQVTTGELDEYDPAWSPDGEWIAFVTQIGTQSDVFVMRSDGSVPANLTNSAYANDFQPVWTADSEQLIFVSYTAAQGEHDLYVMQRDGSQVTAITDDEHDNIAPSLRYEY
jgi:TolB protein